MRAICSADPAATSQTLALDDVEVLTPTAAGKMIALWNNFHAMAAKANLSIPETPLYFIKANTSYLTTGQTIRRPKSYSGRVVYEGEIGIVIGRTCRGASEDPGGDLHLRLHLHQRRHRGRPNQRGFELCPMDPVQEFRYLRRVRAGGGDRSRSGRDLTIKTVLNGQERQNYPVSDMIIPPVRLVHLISQDVTLLAGDVIACGTSVGVGSMKEASNTIEVTIEGIGTLEQRLRVGGGWSIGQRGRET